MANILTLTDRYGNVILTTEVDLKIEIDADQANADIINTALATDPSMTIACTGNSVPVSANTSLMWSTLLFQQVARDTVQTETGQISIQVI